MTVKEKIAQLEAEISAYNTAILEAIPTGGVKEFRQGTTYIIKSTLQELKDTRSQLETELHRLEKLV